MLVANPLRWSCHGAAHLFDFQTSETFAMLFTAVIESRESMLLNITILWHRPVYNGTLFEWVI
jgi:hypothetical protein